MAIYHCSVKTIGRSAGSSAVNSAAYRSGEKLYDQNLGKTFFYSGKNLDVMYKEIIAPTNVKVPSWVYEREKLWNAVEAIEKRKDSQLARELELSLPREFSVDQNIALVREYINNEFVNKGMIADICLHYGMKGDSYNPHAHVMLTMREIGEDGFGKKNTSWNSRALLNEWRESWAEISNKHLSLNGFDLTVDHRSLSAQGIELIPQNVELPVDAKDRLTEQRERQLEIMKENGERLLSNPDIVLSHITKQQSVFTEGDITRYINSRTLGEEQFREVFTKVKLSENLVKLAEREGELLYTTKEILEIEKGVFDTAIDLSKGEGFKIKCSKNMDDLSFEQKSAVDYICINKDFRAVVGHAGTGKTYMLSKACELWEGSGYRVRGVALSGIAAQVLQDNSGISSQTVARSLIDWENDRGRLTSRDVLIVDEAGMLGVRDISKLMSEAKLAGAKVVMLGDPQQLQAIEAGAAFRGIVERVGYLEMSDIRRQELEWQKNATRSFAVGDTCNGLRDYKDAEKIKGFDDKDQAIKEMVRSWGEAQGQKAEEVQENSISSIMLTYKRIDVELLNEKARDYLKNIGIIEDGITVQLSKGDRELSKGDKIYFLRNNNDLNVRNGTLGNIEAINARGDVNIRVSEVAGDRNISFNIKDYNYIDHGYAATVHKAQGITVDKTYVLATRGFNQHLTYVSMTRHTQDVQMFYSKAEFRSYAHLEAELSKQAVKENALDYTKAANEFIERRGLVDVYKDITLKFNKVFSEVKDIVKDIGQSVKENFDSKQILMNIEERMVFRKEMKNISNILNCSVSRGVTEGEKLTYAGVHTIGKEDYAVMYTEGLKAAKIMPYKDCYNIKRQDQVEIIQNKDGHLIAQPTSESLWNRKLDDISKEYGKPVSLKMDLGDTGRFRDIITDGKSSYYIMEQYDKVTLLSSDRCAVGLQKGDYIKIQENLLYNYFGDKKGTVIEACKDYEKHKRMEKGAEKEMVMTKDREIEL
jgi:Ti-type conjugative transfer relaxase TraA